VTAKNSDRLAVLIDADNAQASVLPELLAEVSKYGTASVKRAYGDWTTPDLKGWKAHLQKHAIQPVQQFSFTTGKNATDSALIIDAMDLLHSGQLDGFCLVSSDSDFTRLATRLRESGVGVYGFGEHKTPEPFVAACDRFIFTEILRPEPPEAAKTAKPIGAPLRKIIVPAVEACAREDGWAYLGGVGSIVLKTHSSFDPRNYGYSKLGELVRNQPYLDVNELTSKDAPPILLVRVKPRS
jgi:uncharacterized LabA/DUF88 family protein